MSHGPAEPGPDAALGHTADRQHGAFTRRQANAAGLTDVQLDYRVRTGRIEHVEAHVYRIVGARDTWRQRLMVATLTAGSSALVSHRAAAALWGLEGFSSAPVEIVVERWRRPRRRAGVIVHESTDLRGADRTMVDGIPVTTLVRTLLDIGAVAHWFRVEQALDDACRRRLVTLSQVRMRFLELARRGRPGIGTMRLLLAERPGGTIAPASTFEARMLRLLSNAGLPTPNRQHQVRGHDFVVHVDLAWPEHCIAVECDSLAHHLDRQQFQWDRSRQNRLVLLGWTVLRFTWRDLTDRPDAVAREVRAALQLACVSLS